MSKKIVVLLSVAAALIGGGVWLVCAVIGPTLEKRALARAAESYLQAQAEGDLETVYHLLPPSSQYRQSHSLEQFRADVARQMGPALSSYRIVRVADLRSNDSPDLYPRAQKLAAVEVEVTFKHTGPDTVYNYSFTFLKEKRAWYKA